jgi:hypothetical protein
MKERKSEVVDVRGHNIEYSFLLLFLNYGYIIRVLKFIKVQVLGPTKDLPYRA